MNRVSSRSLRAVGVAGLVTGGLVLAGTSPALAAPNQYAPSTGTITSLIPTGSVDLPINIKTSAACPTGTDNFAVYIDNTANGWTSVPSVGTSTNVGAITTGVPLGDAFSTTAANFSKTLSNGTYDLTLACYPDSFGSEATAQFDGQFTVTGTSFAFVAAAVPSSTTSLAVNPGSGSPSTVFTYTATVASTAATAGTVQYKEGATLLGTAAVGAAFTHSFATGGNHAVTATYVPADTSVVQGSTSSPVSVNVVAPAASTVTTLGASSLAPSTIDTVTLTATVVPTPAGSPVGSVNFFDGATQIGSSAVNGGTAAYDVVHPTEGSHSYKAVFVPTNTANFLGSESAALPVTVSAYAGASASENLTTTVAAGTLTITAGGPTVDLGTPALNADNTLLVTAPKDINDVTVTDTRAGNVGWNVSGSVVDFSSTSGAKINSENLGWTPKFVSKSAGQTVNLAGTVAPGAGLAVSAAPTGAGLKAAKPLASAPAGASVGTAVLNAALVLQAPTTTTAGTYNSVLTLTAI